MEWGEMMKGINIVLDIKMNYDLDIIEMKSM